MTDIISFDVDRSTARCMTSSGREEINIDRQYGLILLNPSGVRWVEGDTGKGGVTGRRGCNCRRWSSERAVDEAQQILTAEERDKL